MQIYVKTDNLSHSKGNIEGIDGKKGRDIVTLLQEPQVWIRAGVLFCLAFGVMTMNLPFYGDQVTLVSAPASYIYEHGIHSPILPDDLNTGHFPLFPLLTAGFWVVFGRNLISVHLLMILCQLFMFSQVISFARLKLQKATLAVFTLLLLCYPVWWAQTAGMSADIMLCGLFFMGLRAGISKKWVVWMIILGLLPLVSLRGWIWAFAMCIYVWSGEQFRFRWFMMIALRTLIALTPIIAYYTWQHAVSRWWIVPIDERYGEHRQLVDGKLLAGKGFEFLLRCIEFGMVIPVVVMIMRGSALLNRFSITSNIGLIAISVFSIALFTLPFRGPILIRYMMPLHVLILIASAPFFVKAGGQLFRGGLVAMTACVFIAQHFIAYPQMRTSIFEYDWSGGSLSHLSYFRFRAEGETYLKAHHIDDSEVGTYFPEYKSFALTDLVEDDTEYNAISPDSIPTSELLIYSNVMNSVTMPMYDSIKAHYTLDKRWFSYPVTYEIYRRIP